MSSEKKSVEPDNILQSPQKSIYEVETFPQKVYRKTKANPFVPIGCFLTVAALTGGLRAFLRKDSKRSNVFMRYRVAAQGFTICAILVGTYSYAVTAKKESRD